MVELSHQQLLEDLSQLKILKAKNVIDIRAHIGHKYSDASQENRALIFARTIHQILNNHLETFDESAQKQIKHILLKNSIVKEIFEITALDIWQSCGMLTRQDDDYIQQLTLWVNKHQAQTYTFKEVSEWFLEERLILKGIKGKTRHLTKNLKNNLIDISQEPYERTNELENQGYIQVESLKENAKEIEKQEELLLKVQRRKRNWALVNRLLDFNPFERAFLKPCIAIVLLLTASGIVYGSTGHYNTIKSLELEETKALVQENTSDINSLVETFNEVEFSSLDVLEEAYEKMPLESSLDNSLESEIVYFSLEPIERPIAKPAPEIKKVVLAPQSQHAVATTTTKQLATKQTATKQLDTKSKQANTQVAENSLPTELQYKEVNRDMLCEWLRQKNSLLAEEPYFSTILEVGYNYNINPLLMFAITGQEQAFVPKSNKYAYSIVNNPFNVFGSWKDYNTDLEDATNIVARTLINLSKGCPENENPLKWINREYAADQSWYIGVESQLASLEAIACP